MFSEICEYCFLMIFNSMFISKLQLKITISSETAKSACNLYTMRVKNVLLILIRHFNSREAIHTAESIRTASSVCRPK